MSQSEHFTLARRRRDRRFAIAHELAGVHYWSYDRDVDCPPGSASPTCNSLGGAGAHGFLSALHRRRDALIRSCPRASQVDRADGLRCCAIRDRASSALASRSSSSCAAAATTRGRDGCADSSPISTSSRSTLATAARSSRRSTLSSPTAERLAAAHDARVVVWFVARGRKRSRVAIATPARSPAVRARDSRARRSRRWPRPQRSRRAVRCARSRPAARSASRSSRRRPRWQRRDAARSRRQRSSPRRSRQGSRSKHRSAGRSRSTAARIAARRRSRSARRSRAARGPPRSRSRSECRCNGAPARPRSSSSVSAQRRVAAIERRFGGVRDRRRRRAR